MRMWSLNIHLLINTWLFEYYNTRKPPFLKAPDCACQRKGYKTNNKRSSSNCPEGFYPVYATLTPELIANCSQLRSPNTTCEAHCNVEMIRANYQVASSSWS
eukprot:Phypoly_transcript_19316.p1 GENE.Phypoly_transcript_19316~~Phypoly_transcript_19316.p1  ORF type:complete len:102 (+),score=0.85 Phypoly_transcript_19316:299-604(+)